jgi:hypothetical protein
MLLQQNIIIFLNHALELYFIVIKNLTAFTNNKHNCKETSLTVLAFKGDMDQYTPEDGTTVLWHRRISD